MKECVDELIVKEQSDLQQAFIRIRRQYNLAKDRGDGEFIIVEIWSYPRGEPEETGLIHSRPVESGA